MGEIRPGCKGARDEIRPTKKLAALSGAHRADDAPLLPAIREPHPADGAPRNQRCCRCQHWTTQKELNGEESDPVDFSLLWPYQFL